MHTELMSYQDPEHKGNGPKYHTGRTCCESGCEFAGLIER